MFRGLAISADDAKLSIPAGKTTEQLVKPVIDHIHDIWCKGDAVVSTFLLKWMAHLIQKP
jgi:hypothetical protein